MCYYARRNATVSSIVAVIDPVDHPGQHIGLISIFCLSMLLWLWRNVPPDDASKADVLPKEDALRRY